MNFNPVTKPGAVPFGVEQLPAVGDAWREYFAWPIPPQTVFDLAARIMQRAADFLIATPEPARSVVLLGRSYNRVAALMEAAIAVQAERDAGLRLEGPRDLAILRGEVAPRETASDTMTMRASGGSGGRLRLLRSVARTKSWTAWPRLAKAMLAPEGVAISHNSLLIADLRRRGEAVRFEPADHLLRECLTGSDPGASLLGSQAEREALTARVLDNLLDDPLLRADMRQRMRQLLEAVVAADIARADTLLAQLSASPHLPQKIWSGTGNFYPSRALGLAAMRRGGTARRYDHGGTASLMADTSFLGPHELAVSTEFVMPTQPAADAIDASARRLAPVPVARIEASSGDPALDPGPIWRRQSMPPRRRVIYVSAPYYGFSQTFPPYPPSPVYIDWQHRLLAALSRLPVDLRHKPHPGGLYAGRTPGLGHYAPVISGWFEDALGDADVVVIDLAATTTLAISMCTDCPIVVLDFGCMPFNPVVRKEIEQRCRIVPVGSDARNRLVVDVQALTEAVCGGPEREDPTFFRRFFLDA
jgi:hypothetical protein